MNKESFLSFLGILVVVILGVFIYYAVTGVKDLDIEDSNTNNTVINDNNSTNNNMKQIILGKERFHRNAYARRKWGRRSGSDKFQPGH